jgi:hypothetical protein
VLTLRARKRAVKSVTYRVGRRTVGRAKKAPYRAAVKPRQLQAGGTQQLTALVAPRKGKPDRVALRLNVALCPSLLTAGVRFSGAKAITQLRLYSRTSIRGATITVPAKLMERAKIARVIPRAGTKVRRSGRNVVISGIPAGTGIVEVDLRGRRRTALALLKGTKPLRFSAKVQAQGQPAQRLLAKIAPSGRRNR